MPRPHVGRWWFALLHVLYFTGIRVGTALQLKWDMLDLRSDGAWLLIPGRIVDKTHKPLQKFLHPAALAAIQAIRTSEPRILAWPHHECYLANRHDKLQLLAGIRADRTRNDPATAAIARHRPRWRAGRGGGV